MGWVVAEKLVVDRNIITIERRKSGEWDDMDLRFLRGGGIGQERQPRPPQTTLMLISIQLLRPHLLILSLTSLIHISGT